MSQNLSFVAVVIGALRVKWPHHRHVIEKAFNAMLRQKTNKFKTHIILPVHTVVQPYQTMFHSLHSTRHTLLLVQAGTRCLQCLRCTQPDHKHNLFS